MSTPPGVPPAEAVATPSNRSSVFGAVSEGLVGRVGGHLAGVSPARMLAASLHGRIHGVPRQMPLDPGQS